MIKSHLPTSYMHTIATASYLFEKNKG